MIFALSFDFKWNFLIFSSAAIKSCLRSFLFQSRVSRSSHLCRSLPAFFENSKLCGAFIEELFDLLTNGFDVVSSPPETPKREKKKKMNRQDVNFKKLRRRKVLEKNTHHLSSSLQLIPVCVRDCNEKQNKTNQGWNKTMPHD